MAVAFDHRSIEAKWQKTWQEKNVFAAPSAPKGEHEYVLDMFPYPSADGLHVGHPEGYTATDIMARYLRMNGITVLHPMGWDAFGLPAENAAIKKGVHPAIVTKQNITNFKRQIQSIGFSYDWDREVNTTDPEYYTWTQWIFLQLFKQGLAYEKEAPIWWCPKDKTGLANEEVVDGKCDRCGTPVEKKMLKQWMLKITEYAERLLNDLEKLDWPESIKALQRNWIGKSEGADVDFTIGEHTVTVFTTRPDTLFGATYMVLSPEHPVVNAITTTEQQNAVEEYKKDVAAKSDLERTALEKDKTGVFTGAYAINPVNDEKIPVWIADYVLMSYGTGAIMAVPAHDERDQAFAKKFKLPIRKVIKPPAVMPKPPTPSAGVWGRQFDDLESACWTGEGTTTNSGDFDGLETTVMREKVVAWLKERGEATTRMNYKLHDWVFSRQRYWGEPIPLIHCPKDGVVPVDEKDLPVLLPEVEKYEPTGTGESPLAGIEDWVNVDCPKCHGPAKRETNTMPQWAGSCWYYLRFTDPQNKKEFASKKALKTWLPVDLYVGGAEHAVLHLLYARFWHKVLYDMGHIPKAVGDEPFAKLKNQGLILGPDGEKMSKSRGNVINPDHIIEQYGADTLRMYEMFMGPFEDAKPWDTNGIIGVRRFLEKVWRAAERVNDEKPHDRQHKYTQRITDGINNFRFNTCVSDFMTWTNDWGRHPISKEEFSVFLKLLSPFAPHVTEELWAGLGHKTLLAEEQWPKFDPKKAKDETVTIAVQVMGKLRATLRMESGVSQAEVEQAAQNNQNVAKYLTGKPKKIIFVRDQLINFVV